MTQTIDSLISEAEVELFEISPFDGQPEFVGYKVDQKELVRLTSQLSKTKQTKIGCAKTESTFLGRLWISLG
jgi:hypothetical protein